MNPTEKHDVSQHILYDKDQLDEIDASLFEPKTLARAGALRGSAQGRGTTHFLEIDNDRYVLRHYRRGGWMANLLGDRYWRTTLSRTRAWREWHLLARLFAIGLPVPKPVAARVLTSGPFYRADLLTRYLENNVPLSSALQDSDIPETIWFSIGQCIRRFHDAGVWHADLNAHNVMLNPNPGNTVYLIDFDKCKIRPPHPDWQRANLARFRRSLDKLSRQHRPFHFDNGDWQALIAGWSKEGRQPSR